MDGVIQWILDNWDVFKTNWKLFVSFGVICCVATAGILKIVYDNFLYKDLPDKRKLQEKIDELSNKNKELRDKNDLLLEERRKICANDIFLNGVQQDDAPSVGELISEAIRR